MALNRSALVEVAAVFWRMGWTAFGGPAAHIALLEDECVHRRAWLDHRRFLDLLSATNLIPGPNSTEMAIHLGRLRAGWPGLFVGGIAFIAPSAILATGLAALYGVTGATPWVAPVLATLRPAVLVVIGQALVQLGRSAVRDVPSAAVTAGALAAVLLGVGEVLVVAVAAALGFGWSRLGGARARGVPLLEIAAMCLKIGATLFGSGYVLVSYLQAELAARGWLSDGALLDGVAIGQVTPGPVSTAATFVGYLLAGVPGAIVATVAIFLPAFVLVAATGPVIERWREHPVARRVLDVVNAAVVGLIAAVVVRLAPVAFPTPNEVVVAACAITGLWALRWSSMVVLTGSIGVGVLRAIFAVA